MDILALNQLARMKFKTREQYLEWREEWRYQYDDLSEEIRDVKYDMRDSTYSNQGVAQSNREFLRVYAASYMALLADAKAKSLKQKRIAMKKAGIAESIYPQNVLNIPVGMELAEIADM